MIAYVKGSLTDVERDSCVVEAGGIGYLLYCPQGTLEQLRERCESDQRSVMLYTRTVHREDALDLYGFLYRDERTFFNLLLTVSGIGPKQALKIMSAGETAKIVKAVVSGDSGFLRSVAGIGEKKARQIILELQEKLKKSLQVEEVSGAAGSMYSEVVEALHSLGFNEREAREAADAAMAQAGEAPDVSRLVENALRHLST